MKTIFLLLITLYFFPFITYSQNTPEEYLNALPVPGNICNTTYEDYKVYRDKLGILIKKIEEEIDKRNDVFDNPKMNKESIEKAMKFLGIKLNPEELKKLETDSLTEDEKTKLQAKLINQLFDGTKNINDNSVEKFLAEGRVGSITKLTMLHLEGIDGKMAAIRGSFYSLTTEADSFFKVNIQPLSDERSRLDYSEIGSEKMVSYNKKIGVQKKKYCEIFTKKYIQYCNAFVDYFTSNKEKIRKLEAEAMIMLGAENVDLVLLQNLNEYFYFLDDIYKFNIITEDEK